MADSADLWTITETTFDPANALNYETIFALGNGTIGMRGTFEEGLPGHESDGVFINGFYDSLPYCYGEKLPGFPEHGQTMIPVANPKLVRIYLEGERVNLATGTLLSYRRSLDLRSGVLTRRLVWRSPAGREAQLESERLVLLPQALRFCAAQRVTVTPLNFSGSITFYSGIDGDVWQRPAADDPRLGGHFTERPLQLVDDIFDADATLMLMRTRTTSFMLACGVRDTLSHPTTATMDGNSWVIGRTYTLNAHQGDPITLTKQISLITSRHADQDDLVPIVRGNLDRLTRIGFDDLKHQQRAFLDRFWRHTDIEIYGDDMLQRGLRFNLFHLLQAVGRDGDTNIAAKGLTGPGYEGHTFWDTEIYILPFFLYTNPEISRKLLEYRYHMLDAARERARELAHPTGALFPWRTISGEECSPYFLAGTAQYHIDADIAFAIKRYWDATHDEAFMQQYGAEMLIETARLWLDAGHYDAGQDGQFCIDAVTGPDEYTVLVNNNAYTNLMARENLRFAATVARRMQAERPARWATLAIELGLDSAEIDAWQHAADHMFVPFDTARGIYPQDDTFLHRARWDFETHPVSEVPLLLRFHPLVIYRHQVCKQADLLLAQFLLHDQFTLEQKQRDYAYYEPITTHDSSLSMCIFSILAAELGDLEKAYAYFAQTAIADLQNKKGNTSAGIHAANMGGAWQAIVFGFAGMRVGGQSGEGLSFRPKLPPQWTGYRFHVTYRGRLIELDVTQTQTTATRLEGDPITITIDDHPVML